MMNTNEELLHWYGWCIGAHARSKGGTSEQKDRALSRLNIARANVFSHMAKPSPYARCTICGAPLDVPGRPWSRNCGGDCLACMAEVGDPECKAAIDAMVAGEAVVKMARVVADAFDRPYPGATINEVLQEVAALHDALPKLKRET